MIMMKKILLLLLISTSVMASPDERRDYRSTSTTNVYNTYGYNDDSVKRLIATNSAMTAVPGINHIDEGHSHTNIGMGLGGSSYATGIALGVNHQQGDMSFKGSVGLSGGEKSFGAGAG